MRRTCVKLVGSYQVRENVLWNVGWFAASPNRLSSTRGFRGGRSA